MNQNTDGPGYAAENNFEGDAFRASAGMTSNPVTELAPTRDMYHGTTAIGGVDENADTPAVGGYGTNSTPGVRSDTPLPDDQRGGVPADAFNPNGLSDALTGDDMDARTSAQVFNEPNQTMHNAGSSTQGQVHGVIGDVTRPGGPSNTSGV